MSDTVGHSYQGFIGASGTSFAIRPTAKGLGPTIRAHISVVHWNKELDEWNVPSWSRPSLSKLAQEANLKVLPEARKLAGLAPGSPVLLPGMVPRTAWFSNLRNHLDPEVWRNLSRRLSAACSWRCQICGRKGEEWPTECNEVWEYDEKTCVQRLADLQTICPTCHRSHHLGLAEIRGDLDSALDHLALVNGWNRAEADSAWDTASKDWRRRSTFDWTLDLDRLRDFGITPPKPESPPLRNAMVDARMPKPNFVRRVVGAGGDGMTASEFLEDLRPRDHEADWNDLTQSAGTSPNRGGPVARLLRRLKR